MAKDASLIEANGELKVFIDQNLSPGKGVVSLVAVHPSTVNTLGKQLLPKTFGQSNVNITQQVVSGKKRECQVCGWAGCGPCCCGPCWGHRVVSVGGSL